MTTDLILGTAGHIDHGKTSIIRALTGVDTDRLPEEQKRGITIDLGFAELMLDDFRLGIVDVPGHERFVRNMLAGATGMDLALLVVAADDSVKPQTREHLEILRLLDLPAGVIAITKSDLVEEEWLLLVEDEIRQLVAGSFLADAPILHTSTADGRGIPELKEALLAAARVAYEHRQGRRSGPARMAIDRVFTIAGHGTVVTGSVSRGTISVGDQLEIQPGNTSVRVRGLQNHDRTSDQVTAGQRAAINVAGIAHHDVRRGHELATVGHLAPAKALTARIDMLESAPRPLKNRAKVRIHVGAAECLSTVSLLDRKTLEPGESTIAQLFLTDEVVTTWSQPIVVRSESPVTTIGGGIILQPRARRQRKANERTLQHLANLAHADPLTRAGSAFYLSQLDQLKPLDLVQLVGVEDPEAVVQQLLESGKLLSIPISPTANVLIHDEVHLEMCDLIEVTLRKMHEAEPLKVQFDVQQLISKFSYLEAAVAKRLFVSLQKQKRARYTAEGISLVGCGPKLSQNEQRLLTQLVDWFREDGIATKTIKEYQQRVPKGQAALPQLVDLAKAGGELVEVGRGYYLHSESEVNIRKKLREVFSDGKGRTLSELKDALETTRKYAVPLFEYLDKVGFTKRDGDLRVLAKEGE